MKPGLLYKLMGILCSFMDRCTNTQQKGNRGSGQLVAECLTCVEIIMSSNYQLAEVHMALSRLSGEAKNDKDDNSEDTSNTNDDAASKLELMSLKVPSVSQSRVTYFYEKETSWTGSQATSGQATPLSLLHLQPNHKSWLVEFCLNYASISNSIAASSSSCSSFSLKCIDLLIIVCKRYFELLSRDLFFDHISALILANIDFPRNNRNYMQIRHILMYKFSILASSQYIKERF